MKDKLYDQETGSGITACNPHTTVGFLCPFIYLQTTKLKDEDTSNKDHYKHIQDFVVDYNPND